MHTNYGSAQSFPLAHYQTHQHNGNHYHQHQHHRHINYAQPNEYTRPPPPTQHGEATTPLSQDGAHYSTVYLQQTPSPYADVHPNGHKTMGGSGSGGGAGSSRHNGHYHGPALPMRNGSATMHAPRLYH